MPKVISLTGVTAYQASYLIEAALLSLIKAGWIRVHQATIYRSTLGRKPIQDNDYLLVPGESAEIVSNAHQVDGWLEQRILESIAQWTSLPVAHQWPQGAPLYEIVRALFPGRRGKPSRWLIGKVEEEAIARQFGSLQGRVNRHLVPNLSVISPLVEEARLMRTAYDELYRANPVIWSGVQNKIRAAIVSQQDGSE